MLKSLITSRPPRLSIERLAALTIISLIFVGAFVAAYKAIDNEPLSSVRGISTLGICLLIATAMSLPLAYWEARRSEKRRDLHLAIAGSADQILLEPYDKLAAPKLFRNLSRRGRTGETIWVAELPLGSDGAFESYVSAEIVGANVVAHTWRGFEVTIELTTGEIVSARFTK